MTKAVLKVALVAATIPMLGGCSVFKALGFRSGSSDSESSALAERKARKSGIRAASTPAVVAAPLTEIARSQLASNSPGLAIETFNRALGSGEPRPAALNGLGVGYARIGRADVAAQYFRMAIAEAPQEQRYQWNLSQLLKASTGAQTVSREALAALKAPVAAAPAEGGIGRLTRLSPREFTIRTVNSADTVRAQRTAQLEAKGRAAVRIDLDAAARNSKSKRP